MLFGEEIPTTWWGVVYTIGVLLLGGGGYKLISLALSFLKDKRDSERQARQDNETARARQVEEQEKIRVQKTQEESAEKVRQMEIVSKIWQDAQNIRHAELKEMIAERGKKIDEMEARFASATEEIIHLRFIVQHYRHGGKVNDEPV